MVQHSRLSYDSIREIPLKEKFNLAGFDIEAFPVCHDAPETLGYHICYGDKKVTIATDLGHICNTAAPYIKAANLLVIESNYDEEMLVTGQYPYYLRNRIKSDHGHLGNHQASSFLAENIGDNSEAYLPCTFEQEQQYPRTCDSDTSEELVGKGHCIEWPPSNFHPEPEYANRHDKSNLKRKTPCSRSKIPSPEIECLPYNRQCLQFYLFHLGLTQRSESRSYPYVFLYLGNTVNTDNCSTYRKTHIV